MACIIQSVCVCFTPVRRVAGGWGRDFAEVMRSGVAGRISGAKTGGYSVKKRIWHETEPLRRETGKVWRGLEDKRHETRLPAESLSLQGVKNHGISVK